ncbi:MULTISPECIES: tetratricopeptide repeat protein [Paraburkholderia]|uniref:tetratricopeptide repeat protein n=1 Tax=Paraburkholderia TaxID=1822464 RepID=UPI002253D10B|nr:MULTISPECIES: hypothetical protein [Paraburkholderia]MCX4164904.1 hypothetical protein [Paraburkholderia megapolitana]MDN7160397.1 hypothetical protein [Paraburkholderia sp. CHISQ3]MDQ6497444.1 hypothetical protein [Paraburkholderia megapolitana]
MDEYDCWCVVTRFVKNKEYDKAIAFCETEPYSTLQYCQNYLGWTFYQQEKYEISAYWFGKAADQNNGEASFGMGSILMIQHDFRGALSRLMDSVNNGYSRAYFWIALIYYYGGNGVSQDIEQAIRYFKIGADHESLMAERFMLFIESRRGWRERVTSWVRMIPLLIKAWVISARNPYDFRVVDIDYQFEGEFSNPDYKPAQIYNK